MAPGALNLLGGTLTADQVTGSGAGTALFNGGTLRLSGNQADLFSGFAASTVTLTGAGGTIDTQGFAVVTAYEWSGNGALTKLGAGTLTLAEVSNQTYTGPTTVEAGALVVDGSITSNVTVKSGATFGGDGVINGNITLESGSTLTPIDCFDADTLTWNAGATLVFNLSDASSDILELTADFTKIGSGPFAFTFLDTGWQIGQAYTLVTFSGISNFVQSDFSFTNGGGFGGDFVLDGNSLSFTLNSVPEPSMGHLLLLAMVATLFFVRRRALS